MKTPKRWWAKKLTLSAFYVVNRLSYTVNILTTSSWSLPAIRSVSNKSSSALFSSVEKTCYNKCTVMSCHFRPCCIWLKPDLLPWAGRGRVWLIEASSLVASPHTRALHWTVFSGECHDWATKHNHTQLSFKSKSCGLYRAQSESNIRHEPLCLRVTGNLFVVFRAGFLGSYFVLYACVTITLQHKNNLSLV